MKLPAHRHKKPIIIGILLIAVFAASYLSAFEIYRHPRFFAERILAYKFNRPFSIGALTIAWGNPVTIDIDDVRLANASWGTEPEMVSIGHIAAALDPKSLLHGPMHFSHVAIDDASMFLERDKNGIGNWRFGNSHPRKESAEDSRQSLPTMLNLVVRRSQFRMRVSSGAILKIAFSDFDLQTASEDQPVTIKVKGAYNDTPVQMDIAAQSFAALHDAKHPFNVVMSGNAASTSIKLNADMMDPLNFEGVQGQLHAETQKIGKSAALFGSAFHGDVPLVFDSKLTRNGDVWNFTDVQGNLGGNAFDESRIKLVEGARLQPDLVQTSFNFEKFDLTPFLAGLSTGREMYLTSLDKNMGVLVDAALTAKTVTSDTLAFKDVNLHAAITSGAAAIDKFSMSFFGGKFQGAVSARAVDSGNVIVAKASLDAADLAQLLKAFDINDQIMRGKFDLALALTAAGGTMHDLKTTGQGAIVFSANKGEVSKRAVQLASLDWKALFHDASSPTPMNCFLAILELKDGIGRLSPFRLDTAAGNIVGTGQIDLGHNALNLTFQADKNSTSPSALDKPIRITGDIDKPSITPLIFSAKDTADQATTEPPQGLPAALRAAAKESACN